MVVQADAQIRVLLSSRRYTNKIKKILKSRGRADKRQRDKKYASRAYLRVEKKKKKKERKKNNDKLEKHTADPSCLYAVPFLGSETAAIIIILNDVHLRETISNHRIRI